MTSACSSCVVLRLRRARSEYPPRRLVRAIQSYQPIRRPFVHGAAYRYWQRLSLRERILVLEVYGL